MVDCTFEECIWDEEFYGIGTLLVFHSMVRVIREIAVSENQHVIFV
jgi:hypothetical protein